MPAHRLAPLAACIGTLVALVAVSPAVAGTTGQTIRIVNQTGDVLPNGSASTLNGLGTWTVTPPPTLTTSSPGNTGTAVATLDSGQFIGNIAYGPDNIRLQLIIGATAQPGSPFGVSCSTLNALWACSVQNATSTTPWVVNFLPRSNDRTPPAVQVRAPLSLAEETLREDGLRVDLRSNEPGRARIELIARRGARHAVVAQTLRWGGRDYPVTLRLNAAGRRAVQIFDVYTLRVAVADSAGNRRTLERRVIIR
jgi:hypothetical protein